VGLDLLLDAGVVHDPGGIKGVGEEISPLFLVTAELFDLNTADKASSFSVATVDSSVEAVLAIN
jgi:hypothetical protein